MNQFKEIAGQDVILAHRLMKNTIGVSEYMLFIDDINLDHLSIEDQFDLDWVLSGNMYGNNKIFIPDKKIKFYPG